MISFYNDIKRTYLIVPIQLRAKIKFSLVFSLFNGMLDIFSLGVLIPVIIIFLDPAQIHDNQWIAQFYSWVGFTSEFSFRMSILIGIVFIFTIKNLLSTYINHYQNKHLFGVATALSKKSLQAYFNMPYLEFTKSNSSLVSRKVNTIPHDFVAYTLTSFIHLISEIIIGAIILLAIGIYNLTIFLLLVGAIIPVFILWKWFKKHHINRIETDFKSKFPIGLKILMKGVDSYIDVKLHQKQSYFIEKFIEIKREMNTNYAFLKTSQALPQKILEVVLILCIILIFAYASFYQIEQTLIPTLSLFIAGFYRLYPSITKILAARTSLLTHRYVLDELSSIDGEEQTAPIQAINFDQHIKLDNISFSYPNKESLIENFKLKINKGQCIGITGGSGSGKTTLIKLLIGLLLPNSGKIRIDNTELSSELIPSWLTKIGYLQQQPVIVDASIHENIAFGEERHDTNKIEQILKQTNLMGFINSLPKGLATQIGENGLQISGGQIQRIAMARALYHDSELLIFDEISNNLDEINLRDITYNISKLIEAGKTVLLIDNNPILLQLADKLWCINKGIVTETDNELVQV